MKKTYLYMVLAAVAVVTLAISCVRELDIMRPVIGDNAEIHITPVCVDPATKATEPGDDTYNENNIDSYFWFIYSDADGSTPVRSGHRGAKVDTEIPLDRNFPIQSGNKGYVYVVANLPEKPEEPAAGDEWFELDSTAHQIKHVIQGGTTTTYDGTLTDENGLLTIDFGKNTPVVNNSIVAGQSEFYHYTSATTGVPDPERFVMRTISPVQFEVSANTSVTVTAELKRVAVKIILDLFVAKTVDQTKTQPTGLEEYVKSWDSDISHIQIYMLWGSTHGNLAGTPVTYSNEKSDWFYFASPRYAMYNHPDGGNYNANLDMIEGYVPGPKYNPDNDEARYTETQLDIETTVWEVVYERYWVWNADVPESERTLNNQDDDHGHWGDYKLDDDGNKIPVIGADGNVQRQPIVETQRSDYYQISSLPLYTMPISWNVNDAHAPFIKVILPWQGHYTQAVEGHSSGSFDPKTTEFYYKVLIPELTTLDANGCYHISLDLSVLGSTADEVPVEVSGKYHVVKWNEPMQGMGGDQTAGRYLKVARDTYEMYGDALEIPFSASGPVVISAFGSSTGNPTATYPLGYSNGQGELNYSTSSSQDRNFKITPFSSDKYVKVEHKVEPFSTSFSRDNGNAKDIAIITYKFRVSLDGYPEYYKDITVLQYPSIYVERKQSSGYPFVNGVAGTVQGAAAYNNNTGTNRYSLGSITSGGSGGSHFTIVSISTLSGISSTYPDWVIGDPRIKLADAYNGTYQGEPSFHNEYANGSNASEWRRSDLGSASNYFDNYLVGDIASRNFIAPKFMLASGYGYNPDAFSNNSTWKSNSERCASYQEDGYPAGRWRVPTEAELLFCATLASNDLIENPFRNQTNYWSTSGTSLYYLSNQDSWNFVTNPSGARSIRCIYDLWYWGDNPVVTPGTYTVMLPE